ncbi:YbgC/FadM family acyl-CoA thioesterase [Campylobacter sp. RM12640]|uniref:YbgC/FadM family acyl-CoA thioesterase n=1 Tax=unclassified Campylobacter TaxID=2593542 RepID=UPI001BDB50B6|nr:YbgC/FadM family acyl-CoA thioesterase [Campylobacter sp. 2018MI13]MBZ7981273.1 YbgC/FadM family acyl-CoA thioesterase [Campylobacter sp. RM12640]MBZ7989487.1 YbgC/FadM family acyl-CoA thioesterase [Campylobacter sp. RM12635]MBZ7990813.1 YbgC/FadM family acyl-CoA thioesterase [Campylobacter sp. RM9331]MBZ8005375.1 YbgC/FadM family acyl-CoA thioesterase [Campylobacter sp. RM9332]MBT0883236.1 YbgC/FadM family acyl-CoA thioesterase [Campylobacter sp. 2018MI13]
MQIRVYYEDTDCMGIVYHTNYLKYCERARSEWFFANEGKDLLKENPFALREIKAIYKAPAKLGDILEVKNILVGFDKYCLELKQIIYKDDKAIFEAFIKLVHIKDGKLSPISEELKKYLSK